MIATNHALTGAIIGVAINHPIAMPLAILSHFALDAIPHYGETPDHIKTKRFVAQLILDATLCGVLVLALALSANPVWLLAAVCAFLAASPDFMWIPKFLDAQSGRTQKRTNGFLIRFHSKIQWFQRPIGAAVEVVWLSAAVFILVNIV